MNKKESEKTVHALKLGEGYTETETAATAALSISI